MALHQGQARNEHEGIADGSNDQWKDLAAPFLRCLLRQEFPVARRLRHSHYMTCLEVWNQESEKANLWSLPSQHRKNAVQQRQLWKAVDETQQFPHPQPTAAVSVSSWEQSHLKPSSRSCGKFFSVFIFQPLPTLNPCANDLIPNSRYQWTHDIMVSNLI